MKKLLFISSIFFLMSYVSIGQPWVPVGAGVNNEVYVLDSCLGNLYVGGIFTLAGGNSASNIASWNGASWSALGSGLNGPPYAIAAYNGNLIVGGSFSLAGGNSANYIALWNGSTWSALGSGLNGPAISMAIYKGNLIVGGGFSMAGGSSANNIAMWNGSSWAALGSGLNSEVSALAVYNGNLYAGGYFDSAGGQNAYYIAKWNGTKWDSLQGIGKHLFLNPCVSPSYVLSLGVYNGSLYVGGFFGLNKPFPNANQTTIGKWNDTTWVQVPQGFSVFLDAFCNYKGLLYAGGCANIDSTDQIASWNDILWDTVGGGIIACNDPSCDPCGGGLYTSEIFAIAGYRGNLYAGGDFTTATGNQAGYIEEYTGSLGVKEVSPGNNSISVFPNPNDGSFQLVISNYQLGINCTVEVYNMLGEKVYNATLTTADTPIDLGNSASGLYLYRLINETGGFVSSGKLIIEKQ